ncbi:MAG: hypothetical protein M0Z47_10885 [Actinomycetota bacterium]|nr:hypothetical protein [Actinomycetota bacterium]
MSMTVEITCNPDTLTEVGLAERIIRAARQIVEAEGGSLLEESGRWWAEGLILHANASVSIPGALVPPLRHVDAE